MNKSITRAVPAIGAVLLAMGASALAPPQASAVPPHIVALAGPHDTHPIPHDREGPKGTISPSGESADAEERSQRIYTDCDQIRAEGIGPLYRGQPGFNAQLDPDGDGIACD